MNNPKSTKAYLYLIKIISNRDYSEYKLREKLKLKNFLNEEIEEAINEIKTKGYLREEIYAEARIKNFMQKGYSPDHIMQKLSQEHLSVSQDDIEVLFTDYQTSPENQIEQLIRKKIRGKSELTYEEQCKIIRYLISKGHDYEISKKHVKNITNELHTSR
jgi:regulatory protein